MKNQIELIDNIDDIYRIANEWDAVLTASKADTIFLTSDWLLSWWEGYQPNGKVMTLVAKDKGGPIIGIAPLYRRCKHLCRIIPYRALLFLGDGTNESEYLDFFSISGRETEVLPSFFGWLSRNEHLWDICEWNIIPEKSPSLPIIRSWAAKHNYVMMSEQYDYCHIPLPGDWNSYLDLLTKTYRKNVRYYVNRAKKRSHVEYHCPSTNLEVLSALNNLFQLHQKRWETIGEMGSFSDPGRRQFYQAMSKRFLDRGWLRLYTLRLMGQAAAVQFGFVYNRIFHALQEGFDPNLNKESPGVILRAKAIEELIQEGISSYDFLGRPTNYKTRWGTEIHRRCISLKIAKRSLYARAVLELPNLVTMLKRQLRKVLPTGKRGHPNKLHYP